MRCRPDWCKNRRPNIKCEGRHQDCYIHKGGGQQKQESIKDNHVGPWGTTAGETRDSSFIDALPSALEPNSSDSVILQVGLMAGGPKSGRHGHVSWGWPLPEEWGNRTEHLREISYSDLSFFIVPENRPEDNSDQQSPQADDTHWQRMQSNGESQPYRLKSHYYNTFEGDQHYERWQTQQSGQTDIQAR